MPKFALLLAGTALCAPAFHAPVAAQAQAAATAAFEDIVVTARKREESLQQVPLAITALTADEIQSARIESLDDVARLTPGLNFTPLFGAQNQLPIIRGQAQTFGQLNVGVFLDGVYLTGKAAVDIELADLERVEVVRGPQSALYGRNTFAGAINYVTRRPSAEPEFRGEVTVGDNGLVKVLGGVSGPIGDLVRVRVSGFYRDFDGWYTSAIDGGRVDFSRTRGAQAVVEVAPVSNVTLTLRGAWSDEESGQPPSNVIRTNAGPGQPAGSPVGTVRNILYIGEVPSIPRDGVTVNTSGLVPVGFAGQTAPYGQNQTVYRASARLEVDTRDVLFTSISSWDRRETDYVFDGDNTICDRTGGCPNFGFPFVPAIPFGTSQLFTSSLAGTTRDIAQEFRFASQPGGPIDWLTGIYYYDSRTDTVDRSVTSFAPAALAVAGFPRQILTTKSMAVFGSLGWRPSETVRLTAELRYENEAQSFTQRPTNPAGTGVSARRIDLKGRYTFLTPRFIADWQATPDALLYASVARGAKTGGFNTNVNVFDDQRRFDPEYSWNYEVGAKTDLFDRRVRLNVAGYYTDWTDQQVACQNPPTAGGTTTQRTYVCNVGQARIYGLETEAVLRLTDFLSVTGSYTFTDARYKAFVDDSLAQALLTAGLPPIDFNGKRLPYVPRHKVTASPRISVPMGRNLTFDTRADVVYQSRSFVRADNLQSFGPRTIVDVRAGVTAPRWAVQLFVDNVFDDDTPVAGVRFFDAVNFSVSSPLVQGPPRRQFGGTFRVNF